MPYDEEKTGNVDLANEVVTGYSIYNQDVKKRTKHNPLSELYPALPDGKYDVIYMQTHHGIIMGNCNMTNQVKRKKNLTHQNQSLSVLHHSSIPH